MARRQCAAKRPRHYQERSAVVTRRSEPANTRVLAGFCKFSVSDAEINARFRRDQKNPSHLIGRLCINTKEVLHLTAGVISRHGPLFVLA